MKFLLALLLCVVSARAITYVGGVTLTAPYTRTDSVTVVGNLTLEGPGTFSAQSWNVTGNVIFTRGGAHSIVSTDGGFRLVGNVAKSTGSAVTVSFFYTTSVSATGTYADGITVIDGGRPVTVEPPPASAPNAPLLNISTRAQIGAGGSLNPGFVIGGSVARRMLIRAVGPGLIPLGVSGTMANPTLAVFSGQTQIAANDDHNGAGDAVAAAVGGFPLPAGSRDAVLVLTLPPGGYTVLIRGGAGEGGDVLAEVYFVN